MAKTRSATRSAWLGTSRVTCIIGEPATRPASSTSSARSVRGARCCGNASSSTRRTPSSRSATPSRGPRDERPRSRGGDDQPRRLANHGLQTVRPSSPSRDATARSGRRRAPRDRLGLRDTNCGRSGRSSTAAQEFIVDDQDGINDPRRHDRRAARRQSPHRPSPSRRGRTPSTRSTAASSSPTWGSNQLAAADSSLTEEDKEFGSALVEVGAETTGLSSSSAGRAAHAVFARGGSHFTKTSPSG